MPGTTFLGGLRVLLQAVSEDMRAQIEADPSGLDRLRSRRPAAGPLSAALTLESSWLDTRLRQSAGAWVVGALILQHLRETSLWSQEMSTDTHREWLLGQFQQVAMSAPGARLFHPDEDPLFDVMVSEKVAQALRELATTGDSDVVNGDPTYFLGDVYQDVVGHADSEHALIQTPGFVVDRVLELALEPAITGLRSADVQLMDPVCGSGEFLVQAFHRLLRAVRSDYPSRTPAQSVKLALACIHGMDINPTAATIARFRLLLAAITAAEETTLRDSASHGWAIDVRVGDSLLALDAEQSKYDVVVGNPPYLTPQDKSLDNLYRSRYSAAQGRYSLTVPFIQLFLRLARQADAETAGRVALLCANSFTKRQFGKPLIENVLRREASVTHVIDTGGAFIPGHGAPTLILIARHRASKPTDQVFAVLGLHGEPRRPEDPAQGLVWRSIGRSLQSLGHRDRWTTSTMVDHDEVTSFPWAFATGATASVLKHLGDARRLGSFITRVGYHASIGAEEIFAAPRESFDRDHTEPAAIVPIVSGENVRDWSVAVERYAFLPHPYSGGIASSDDGHLRRIWPYKTTLGRRATFSGKTYQQEGKPWYSWHQPPAPDASPQVVYSAIGSTAHFALLPHGAVAMPSAPVIDGIETMSPADLVAWLNTSTTIFWLQQHSPGKGQPNAEQTAGEGEPWETRYQFLPSQIRDVPLPPTGTTNHASELSRLAEELSHHTPGALLSEESFDGASLAVARSHWSNIRSRMVALAEELDWQTYAAFGFCDASLLISEEPPPIKIGQRAFEIHLAQKTAESGTPTRWFERHGATPHLQPPSDWPEEYRRVVAARLRAIEQDARIAVLEQPAHKRRWLTHSWEAMAWEAFEEWVITRCEQIMLKGSNPHRLWLVEELVGVLKTDSQLVEAAAELGVDRSLTEDLGKVLLANQVPALAALRYRAKAMPKWQEWQAVWDLQARNPSSPIEAPHQEPQSPPMYAVTDFLQNSYWRNRGKYDIPREPFFSSPTPEGMKIGCSRWTPSERAEAMINTLTAETRDNKKPFLIPLLASIRETLEQKRLPPSSRQVFDNSLLEKVAFWEGVAGVTVDDLHAWQPEPPRRGRPRKHP